MSDVLTLSGSPSRTSGTERAGEHLANRITATGWSADHPRLRALPAEPLLGADTGARRSPRQQSAL